jgi:hypothetical protein
MRVYSSLSRATSAAPELNCSGLTSSASVVSMVASLRDNSSIGNSLRKFSPTLPLMSAAWAISASSV